MAVALRRARRRRRPRGRAIGDGRARGMPASRPGAGRRRSTRRPAVRAAPAAGGGRRRWRRGRLGRRGRGRRRHRRGRRRRRRSGRRGKRRPERRGDRRVRPGARGRRADDRRRRRQHRRVQLAEAPGEPHPVKSIRTLSLSAHHLQHRRHGGRLLEERVGQLEAQVGVDRRGRQRIAQRHLPLQRHLAVARLPGDLLQLGQPLVDRDVTAEVVEPHLRQRQAAAQEGISRHLERRLPVTDHHVVAGEGDFAVGLGQLAAR